MKFNINKIEYDVELFENNNSSILHFYKEELEPKDSSNLTIAHSGYGYIIVRRIDENQTILISGYLNSNIFNKKNVENIIDFVQQVCQINPSNQCVYHHIDFVEEKSYDEYNGEY